MDHQKSGALIASRRRELGMTQKELADRLGISDRTVSKWERGAGFPDISLIEPLADCLSLTVLELLHGEESKPEKAAEQSAREMLQTYRPEIESRFRRTRGWIIVLAVMLIGVLTLALWLMLKELRGNELGEEEISAAQTLEITPYAIITVQDIRLLEALRQDAAVTEFPRNQGLTTLDEEAAEPYEALADTMGLELSYFIVQISRDNIHVEYGSELTRIALNIHESGTVEKTVLKWPEPYPYLEGGKANPDSGIRPEYVIRNLDNTRFFKRIYETGLCAIF